MKFKNCLLTMYINVVSCSISANTSPFVVGKPRTSTR